MEIGDDPYFETLKMKLFAKIVNGINAVNYFCKKLHVYVRLGFECVSEMDLLVKESYLNHFQPMFHFYAPENLRKPEVFRGYKSGTLVENGLSETAKKQYMNCQCARQ